MRSIELISMKGTNLTKYNIDTELRISHSPLYVIQHLELNTFWYVKVFNSSTDEYYTIRLLDIMLDTPLGKVSTWDEFDTLLTEVICVAYSTTIPDTDKSKKVLRNINVINHLDLELSYTSINTPEDRNNRYFRHIFTDIAISKKNPNVDIDFKNCLCSINGIITRPVVFRDELFFKNGVKYFKNMTSNSWPSVELIDFSKLGNIQIVSFSECEHSWRNELNDPNPYTEITFNLPKNIDLRNKTVFPVVCNSLFFGDNIKITSPNTIILSPSKFPITSLLTKKMNYGGDLIENTLIGRTISQNKYITDILPNSYDDNFFVIIDIPRVFVSSQSTYEFVANNQISNDYQGILLDIATQSIYNYTKVHYDSLIDLYLNRILDIHPLNLPPYENTVSIQNLKCIHDEELYTLSKGNYYLVRVVGA